MHGPKIANVLIRWAERRWGGEEDAELLVLKVKEGVSTLGMEVTSRSWRAKETNSPRELPEGTQPCRPTLDF